MARTMVSVISIALATATLGGCLVPPQGPKTGAVASGEPLQVVDDIKVWTTTSKEKVGETQYKDADGNVVGTGTVYADKTQTHSMKIWYGVQGKEQLSDEDFFRISGEQKALDDTLAMRANGKTWTHRGYGTMAGGIVGLVVGLFIPNTVVRTILVGGGGLATTGGYYMAWYGANEESPATHAVDRSVADRAANSYNQQLGHAVGVSGTF